MSPPAHSFRLSRGLIVIRGGGRGRGQKRLSLSTPAAETCPSPWRPRPHLPDLGQPDVSLIRMPWHGGTFAGPETEGRNAVIQIGGADQPGTEMSGPLKGRSAGGAGEGAAAGAAAAGIPRTPRIL